MTLQTQLAGPALYHFERKEAMTITNGDATLPGARLGRDGNVKDSREALMVLKNEYDGSDGLDALTLLDSRKNGGLTYNDFLILPGYVGT